MLTKLSRIGMGLAAMVLAGTTFALAETSATPASTTVAQASPAPTATSNPFSYRGYVRAYNFTRQNAYNGTNGTGKVNQQSFNAAISLHGDYMFSNNWNVGASYLYANPLSNCTLASSRFPNVSTNPCSAAQKAPNTNPDDTLPGFEMSTLYEAYVQYKSPEFYAKGGNQVINTPWANASDSRLKPDAFQGVDASYAFNKMWTGEAAYYWQWECRTCSNFDRGTLLTTLTTLGGAGGPNGFSYGGYAGASALQPNIFDPAQSTLTNNGFVYARLGYTGPKEAPLVANGYYYGFSNIANAFWLDARYPLAGKLKPFVALQAGTEANAGTSLVGKISAGLFGLQAGFNVLPNVQLIGGFDTMPWKTDNVTLPAGFSCNPVSHQISSPSLPGTTVAGYGGNLPYFLPTGGTAQCTPQTNGTTDIYYGGWASPYTDSYATDQIFTTDISQGMADRRSAGNSFKLQATFTSDDKRLVAYVNHAWYDYNNPGYANSTQETNFDTLYYFSKLPKTGPYHGFSFRYRYAERSQSPLWTGATAQTSLFKYNRFQAEYDF